MSKDLIDKKKLIDYLNDIRGISYLGRDLIEEIIDNFLKFKNKKPIKVKKGLNEKLIGQLQRLEGMLGKYNCQYGGLNCNFQTNCHRLIREEINKLKEEYC